MKGSRELMPEENAVHVLRSGAKPREDSQWHAAFQYALPKELEDYANVLEFDFEVPLTTEPLRIDAVIVKKKGGGPIGKNIGKIFRSRNIFEYKSPEDSFSIKDFKKTFAYAHLYEYLHDGVNRRDLTVSIVLTKKPINLLGYLKSEGCGVTNPEVGICYIEGLEYACQIIESKKLGKRENAWLNALSDKVDSKSMLNMIEMAGDDKAGAAAYIHALMLANPDAAQEVIAMGSEELEIVLENAGYMPKEKAEALLQEKEELIQEKEELIQEKEEFIQEKEEFIQEKEELIQEKEELIQEIIEEKKAIEVLTQENSIMKKNL
ncbi:MAG: hypothetical protein LBU32_02185, partial [Clostridiales bacterium]|nr:hypothetical protein [Clostridiales bacterium]